MHTNPSDSEIAALLRRVKTFAVVGASPKPDRPSHGVMRFLQSRGYTVIPVNPGLAGKDILGARVYGSLEDVPGPVDVVDIFRQPDAAYDAVQVALAERERLGISVVWMQLGVINEDAAAAAQAAGLTVVMDRCPAIEIPRLL